MAELFDAVADGLAATTVTSAAGVHPGSRLRDAAERFAQWLRVIRSEQLVVAASDIAPAIVATVAGDLAAVPVLHVDPASTHPWPGTVARDVASEGVTGPWYEDAEIGLSAADGAAATDLDGVPAASHTFLTSGSTGSQVGIVRGTGAVLADALRVCRVLRYDASRPVLVAAPVHHAYGFNYGLVAPLLAGAPIVYLGPRTIPSRVERAVTAHRVDTMIAHPALYQLIAGESARTGAAVIGGLRQAVSAGAPLPTGSAAEVVARHEFALLNCYGSSEAGAVTLSPVSGRERVGDAGLLLPGVQARIAESGELLLRTDSLAAGFRSPLGRQPLDFQDGWYRTGDLATVNNLRVFLQGRIANVINVAGEKVNPEEIERVLAAHPEVADVEVYGESEAARGAVPVALVVVRSNVPVTDLLWWCRDRLDPHKVPRRIEIRDQLLRSLTGKRLRSGNGVTS